MHREVFGCNQGEGSNWDLFDLLQRHKKTLTFYFGNDDLFLKHTLTIIVKFQQLNCELPYMKHSQEVSKSDFYYL